MIMQAHMSHLLYRKKARRDSLIRHSAFHSGNIARAIASWLVSVLIGITWEKLVLAEKLGSFAEGGLACGRSGSVQTLHPIPWQICIRFCVRLCARFCVRLCVRFCVRLCIRFCIRFCVQCLYPKGSRARVRFCVRFCDPIFSTIENLRLRKIGSHFRAIISAMRKTKSDALSDTLMDAFFGCAFGSS